MKIENLFCRGPIVEYAIRAPEFVMEIFLCAPKGFWLNFNNHTLQQTFWRKKCYYIPWTKIHAFTFQVHLHLQKVLVHPSFVENCHILQ